MAIEFKKPITFTKDSTIYGHNAVDEGGFPTEPGNGKLSQVLDMAEDQTMSSLKAGITFLVDSSDSLLYHFCIDGTSVATFSVPPDKFLKSVAYDEDTRELVFTFTSGSTESSVRVNMSSLVDVYTAGNGLSLSSGVFSIKIKNTETRLKVDLDGLYIDMSDIISKIETETSQRQATYTDLDSRITALNLTFTNMTDEIASDMAAAKSAKEDAEKAATLAQGYQTTAAEKATSASNSALRAANSATEASDSAALAKDWAVKTSGKVDNTDSSAKTYAIASKNYSTNAETSATNASNSATEAANSATNAKQSEETALAYKEEMSPDKYMKKSAESNLEMNAYNILFGSKTLIDFIWVVGEERYFTDADFDPNAYYAAIKGSAVWEKQTDGRFRVAAGSGTDGTNSWTFLNGDIGGEEKHMLTTKNIPKITITTDSQGNHTHPVRYLGETGKSGINNVFAWQDGGSILSWASGDGSWQGPWTYDGSNRNRKNKVEIQYTGSHTHSASIGEDSPDSIAMIPPYMAVTIWRRVQ